MNQEQRSLIAAVVAIRAQLAGQPRPIDDASELPQVAWDDLVRVTRRVELARRRGWHLAAAQLTEDQIFEAECLSNALVGWARRQRERPTPSILPNAGMLYRELAGLKREFGEFTHEGITLSIKTEPIELEGIALGPFRIELDLSAIGILDMPYRVVAVDPNPAGSSSGNVTHPHVQDELLCPGNGRPAIDKALRDWRLYDFFLIVNQILLTYAEGSAYVRLDNWDGVSCSGCGDSTDEEESQSCQGCGCTLCTDCSCMCQGCDYDFCSNCSSNCAHCDVYQCASCLLVCPNCKAAVCSGCREHETLCKKCHEREQTAADEEEPVESPPPRARVRAAV
jgi:hypothetical protein